jgi:hypothetical protein
MRQPRPTLLAVARAAFVAVLAIFVANGDASAQSKPSVAVLGLEVIDDGTGIDPQTTDLAKNLTEALRAHSKLDRSPYRLAPNSDKELLELKLLSGCANEAKECMARIGRDLSADWLIYGKIERRDTGYQVTIKLLNVESMNMARVTTEVIPFADNTSAKISERGRFLFNRLTGTPEQGTLTIEANVDQGRVFVDGQLATTLRGGKARIDGLAEGKHPVAIESEGHGRYETTVEITAGDTAKVDAELQATAVNAPGAGGGGAGEERPGGTSRTLFWVAAGVTAVSVAGFTVTGLQVLQLEDDATKMAMAGSDDPCDGAAGKLKGICDDGEQKALLTNVLIGVAVASGLAAGYFYYNGYMQADGGERAVAARKKKKATETTVKLTPTVTPDYFGAGVKIEF